MRTTALAACLCGLAIPPAAYSQTILIDDFEDGDDADWMRISSRGGDQYGPPVHEVVEGPYSKEYRLSRDGVIPKDKFGFVVSTWNGEHASDLSDGYLRARLRTEEEPTQIALFMRLTGSLDDGFNGYWFGGDTKAGMFSIMKLDGGLWPIAPETPQVAFGPNEDWMLEAGAIGNRLSLKVWEYGEPEPEAPQWEAIDDSFSSGSVAVFTNVTHQRSEVDTTIDARFDDLYFDFAYAPGDANGDGLVDLVDFSLLKASFGTDDVFTDFDESGVVDLVDFNILKDNFGTSGSVPEPSGALIASICGFTVLLGARRGNRESRCAKTTEAFA